MANASSKKLAKRKPPTTAPASQQYVMFTQFFGKAEDTSNTIELWDAIPKYAVSARRQVSMRDPNGRLPVHEYRFEYADRKCRLEVQPASIKVKDPDQKERFQDFYPSADEELVEEVIRKIFADQRYGVHVTQPAESWVRFSVQMIRKELAARGKTRSLDEIKRSIEILAKTIVSFYVEGEGEEPIYTAATLNDLTRVTRATYEDDTSALWAARLPALISKSINELTFRQFNYGTLMTLSSQLARWLHKRLSHNYTNASMMHPYTVLYSTLRRDSGLIEGPNITKSVAAVEQALDELVERGVLMDWKRQERREARNKLVDVIYSLTASMNFATDVKAANGRQKEARTDRRSIPTLFQK